MASKRFNPEIVRGMVVAGGDLFSDQPVMHTSVSGFVWHRMTGYRQNIKIRLDNPYVINHIDLMLYNAEWRHYSYRIDVSTDDIVWTNVVTKINQQSMQSLDFCPIFANIFV